MDKIQAAIPTFIGVFGALFLLIILTYAYSVYSGATLDKVV